MKKMLIDLVLLVFIPFTAVFAYCLNPKFFAENVRKIAVLLIVYFLLAVMTTVFITPQLFPAKTISVDERKAFWNVQTQTPTTPPPNPIPAADNSVEAQTKRFFHIEVSPSPTREGK